MRSNHMKRSHAIHKELRAVEKQEKKLERAALGAKPAAWKTMLESKLPAKVYSGLESAFCKGFSVVFNQGRAVIEKGYNKENMQADHAIRDYAVQLKGGRRELRQISKSAGRANFANLAVTTAEGIGLGALGIGMPDIVLFLGMLLKGIYETALHYGFSYESREEQDLILKMMVASLCSGEAWAAQNAQIDSLMSARTDAVSQDEFEAQLKTTASAFAMDMLLLKFIQGLPVVGIIGGAANPVYYNKVIKYVQLKYRKRYLLKLKANLEHAPE